MSRLLKFDGKSFVDCKMNIWQLLEVFVFIYNIEIQIRVTKETFMKVNRTMDLIFVE